MTRLQATPLVAASAERLQSACVIVPRRRDDTYFCREQVARSYDSVADDLQDCFDRLVTGRLPWPLYLHGVVGSGKTRAVLALCDQREFARLWTLHAVTRKMFAKDSPWEGVWRLPGGPRLAVLDEIGMHIETKDWEYDALLLFSEWREDTPVIYVSNHPREVILTKYDERIQSRLGCGTVFELPGPDRRLRR